MQVTYNARAFVNEDGQVSVGLSMDGREQPSQSGTREVSRSFALEVLTKQGDEGERAAAEWLRSKGWDVGKPKAIVLEHVGLDGFARWAVSLDGPNPEPAIPVPGRSEAHDLAAKLNSMDGEKPKPSEKPSDKEKKPDLPALYREAARWVRTISAMVSRPVPAFNSARDALIACAKADPDTADALRAYADVLTTLDGRALGAIADHLEKCARLAETAADVASPIKLASWVEAALGHAIWPSSPPAARSYLRSLSEHAMLRLSSDLADRVKRYVEAS